jgi:hypothetical protein
MKISIPQLANAAFVVLSTFFLTASCDSPDLKDNPVLLESSAQRLLGTETAITISKKSHEDQLNYRRENLKVLGEAIIKMSQDQEFRKLVYSTIDKRFDGDDNVLIETLFTSNLVLNDKESGTLKMYTKNSVVQKSLHAFKNIEGENYFPHVYIPYYGKFKLDRNLSKPLIIVPWDGSEITDQAHGYTINDGKFEEIKNLVDRDFCEKNEVWVVSLNERVDKYGKLRNGVRSDEQAREAASLLNTNQIYDGKISYMFLRASLESVYGGQNDMYINGGSTFINGIDPSTGSEKNWRVFESERCQIANIPNGHIGGNPNDLNDFVYVNFKFYNNWDPYRPEPGPRGTHFFYTIYEADNWPAGLRTIDTSVGNKVFTLEYRSSDDACDAHNISFQNAAISRDTQTLKYYGGLFNR